MRHFCFSFCCCYCCCFLYKMVKKYHIAAREVALVLQCTANDNINSGNLSRGQLGKIEQKDLKMYVHNL